MKRQQERKRRTESRKGKLKKTHRENKEPIRETETNEREQRKQNKHTRARFTLRNLTSAHHVSNNDEIMRNDFSPRKAVHLYAHDAPSQSLH